ncbi:MAG: hypothetical protein H7144_16640, partial [Burkholderiales bacterium]|nr:hypothetical protein [Phycisphaerae bacterium]
YPDGIAGWTFQGNASKNVVDIVLPDGTAPGAKVWFTAFWFNNRKQSSPNTDPVSTNVQGGGVSMAA